MPEKIVCLSGILFFCLTNSITDLKIDSDANFEQQIIMQIPKINYCLDLGNRTLGNHRLGTRWLCGHWLGGHWLGIHRLGSHRLGIRWFCNCWLGTRYLGRRWLGNRYSID
jgi:hypothetical protein